jgi:hypothetical protein
MQRAGGRTKVWTVHNICIYLHLYVSTYCPADFRFAPHLEKCMNGGKRGGLSRKRGVSSKLTYADGADDDELASPPDKIRPVVPRRPRPRPVSSDRSLIVRFRTVNQGMFVRCVLRLIVAHICTIQLKKYMYVLTKYMYFMLQCPSRINREIAWHLPISMRFLTM